MIWTDTQLLNTWERGYAATPVERALLLAALAQPDRTVDELLDLPVGFRDGCLLQLRRSLFGQHVVSTAYCPQCQTKLELSFPIDPLIELTQSYAENEFDILDAENTIRVRLPSTRDILAVGRMPFAERTMAILDRCIVERSAALINSNLVLQRKLSTELELRDPLADIEFSMQCFQCSNAFMSSFDIASFLWSELNAWGQRLMSEIHLLARSYCWTQKEILQLSSWRRQVYLNMVRQ